MIFWTRFGLVFHVFDWEYWQCQCLMERNELSGVFLLTSVGYSPTVSKVPVILLLIAGDVNAH